MRQGAIADAIQKFDDAIALVPDYAEAIVARAESIDLLGQNADAPAEYEKARALWSRQRPAPPDLSYVYRQSGRFSFEIESYELALRRIKTGAMPHVALGNSLLAQGRVKEALQCYDDALKVKKKDPNILTRKAEALMAIGRIREASDIFDALGNINFKSIDMLSSRAICRTHWAYFEGAHEDWRDQLELLGPGNHEARAYIFLRMIDYEAALPELERALAEKPDDPYLQLYRLTALRRLGRPANVKGLALPAAWPGPLLALHAGEIEIDDVFERADTFRRRTEADFQLGVLAADRDLAKARDYWAEVIRYAPPWFLEYCVARHERERSAPSS